PPSKDPHVEKEEYHPKCALSSRHSSLTPEFNLAGVNNYPSADINSYLNFRDYLAILQLQGAIGTDVTYQLAYSFHSITQKFKPDDVGELIYQGVASTATHSDLDNTVQGDFTYQLGSHTLASGFYIGEYRVIAENSSLVFPVDADGNQTSDVPMEVKANTRATNIVAGVYLNDLWQITDQWR